MLFLIGPLLHETLHTTLHDFLGFTVLFLRDPSLHKTFPPTPTYPVLFVTAASVALWGTVFPQGVGERAVVVGGSNRAVSYQPNAEKLLTFC